MITVVEADTGKIIRVSDGINFQRVRFMPAMSRANGQAFDAEPQMVTEFGVIRRVDVVQHWIGGKFVARCYVVFWTCTPTDPTVKLAIDSVEEIKPDFLNNFDEWLVNAISRHAPWRYEAAVRFVAIRALKTRVKSTSVGSVGKCGA